MPQAAAEIAALLLAATFALAAAAKLLRRRRWLRALDGYGIPGRAGPTLALVVPAGELGVAVLAAAGQGKAAAASALALLAAFSLAVVRARALEGPRVPCGCFGGSTVRDYRLLLARNAVLAALAASVLSANGDVRPLDALAAPSPGELVAIGLALAGVAVAVWTVRAAAGPLRGRPTP